MRNNNRSRRFGGNKNKNFRSRGRSYRGGGRGRKTPLNPYMFVRKAVDVEEEEKYEAKNKFIDFVLNETLQINIDKKGYVSPTAIQDQAIPTVLEGNDVVGIANTGTGKTAAFLLPLIKKTMDDKGQKVLIVAPTRELALQIQEEFRHFAKATGIYSVLCIGGSNINCQIRELKRNPNFVIGTPGRILDLEDRREINLGRYQSVVLDEVDRMLDMGFLHDIRKMIGKLPKQRQSLFFSATMPKNIESVMQSFLYNPVTVSVKTADTSKNVDQDIVRVQGQDKVELLHNLLIQEEFEKVLVFGRTKHGINKLEIKLRKRGFRAASIHGNKSQGQRMRALNSLKNNEVQVLLATDVASRGIDIDNVTHVINYDAPEQYEDYVHRIGRTGRAGKKGVALTFVE